MMTLDEVIKAFEICRDETCKDCPYAVMVAPDDYRCSEKWGDDAYHYLKAFRELTNELIEKNKQEREKITNDINLLELESRLRNWRIYSVRKGIEWKN